MQNKTNIMWLCFKKRKAQTTMIILFLFIIIFLGIIVFLFSIVKNISLQDYENLYVHNTLLTILRTDTGYTDADCKLVSDVIACSFMKPGWRCGGTGPTCYDLANKKISEYLGKLKKNYKFLFLAEPQWTSHGNNIKVSTDADFESNKEGNVITAIERIQRIEYGQIRDIKVILYMKK